MLPPDARRRVGLIFLGSAALLLGLAVLFGTGIIPLAQPTRTILAGALAAAGLLEGVMGLRFLGDS